MTKVEIGSWISAISLVGTVVVTAAGSLIFDKTSDIRLKVSQHDIAIIRVESRQEEVLRRLDRMESGQIRIEVKIDELTARSIRK